MRFCSAGTAASPTSTARSPRATMMPSDASRISRSFGMASARSIFAMICGFMPCFSPAIDVSWRAISTSVRLLTNETAT